MLTIIQVCFQCLFNVFKSPHAYGMILLCCDVKNFDQYYKSLRKRTGGWLCTAPYDVLRMMLTKIPVTTKDLCVTSNEDHVISLYIFPRDFRTNAAGYGEKLKTTV